MPSTPHLEARIESEAFAAAPFQVQTVVGHEAISRPYRFEIELHSTDADDAPGVRDLLGAEASLVFEREGEIVRTVHGLVAEATDLLLSEPGHRSFHVVLVPRVHQLTLVETQDVFLDTNVPEVVEKKLGLVGLAVGPDVELRLQGTYAKREFILEYQETDLAFVSRLAEHVGISFFFVHDEDGGHDRVIFTDHEDGFAWTRDAEPIPFRARGERASVYALSETARVMPRNFLVSDYNYRTPLVDLLGKKEAEAGLAGGVVEFGANTLTPKESEQIATVRAEERAALENGYRGESTWLELAAGHRFTLEGHPRLDGDAKLLLVEVTHHFAQAVLMGGAAAEAPSYHNTFRAVRADRTYRPPRVTRRPRIDGVLTALVEPPHEDVVGKYAEIDEHGRYTVRFNFDFSPSGQRRKSSLPVRMLQPHAGTGYGMHFPLHPGVEVAIAFEDGDPDRPLIVGAVPNAVTVSPVTRPNANVSRIQTASGVRITIRDHG